MSNAEKDAINRTSVFSKNTARRTWLVSIIGGFAFGLVVALLCYHGAEIANIDSVNYLRFSQTGSVETLPVHYGVGYAIFLWFVSLFGGSIDQITAWGNVVCGFSFAIILTYWFMTCCGWVGALGACAVLANYAILEDYARALSESLFLIGLALGTVGLLQWRASRRWAWLCVSGLATGMACLTRYAGVPFAFCFALCLWRAERRGKRGLLLAGIHLGLSLVGMALVALLHRLGTGTATNRVLDIHWAGTNQFGDTASTISSWFMPDRLWLAFSPLQWVVLGTILILCAWGFVHGWLNHNLRRMVWGISVPAYLLFLYVSYSLFDADIPFDRRMLSSIVPFLFFGLLDSLSACRGKQIVVCWTIMAGLTIFGIFRARSMVIQRFHEGAGWGSLAWNRSPTVQAVSKASAHIKFYSNAAGLLSWRGIENIEGIVFWQLPTTEMDNPAFESSYAQMLDDLRCGRACLLYLQPCGWMKRTVQLEQIVSDANLQKLAEYEDGVIWGKSGALEWMQGD